MSTQKETLGQRIAAALKEAKIKAKHEGRVIDWPEVAEIIDRCLAPKARAKKVADMSDEEWIASLESEPALKGINVRQEIGRAQFWCKNNKRVPTRRFLVNWLNKAEKVVDLRSAGASLASGLKLPAPAGPDGWRDWLKTELATLSDEHPAHGQLTAAFNCNQFTMMPQSWQQRCRQANAQSA